MNALYYIIACILIIGIVVLFVLITQTYDDQSSTIMIDPYGSARVSLDTTGSVIPYNFIQTLKHNHVHPDFYENLVKHNMKMCKEFHFFFYNDDTIRLLIRENFPQYVYDAYMKINPEFGACLSDFGRYCLLYIMGGVYLDIKSEVIRPLYPFIETLNRQSGSSDLLVLSHWRDVNPHWDRFGPKGEIMNWVMISSPRHPVIRELIERMVQKIESGRNGFNKLFVLETTGPILLTETIISVHAEHRSTILITDEINDYFEYISYRCTKYDDCRTLYYHSMRSAPYDTLDQPVLLHKPRIK